MCLIWNYSTKFGKRASYFIGKVNKYINLRNIFRNVLWEEKN